MPAPSVAKGPRTGTNGFPQIDTLNLSLGRATYINLKNPGKTEELSLDVRNQIYTGVNSPTQMQNILLVILLSRHNLLGGDGQHWLEVFGLSKVK